MLDWREMQHKIKAPASPLTTIAGGAEGDRGAGQSEDERRGGRRVDEWMDGKRACRMLWEK